MLNIYQILLIIPWIKCSKCQSSSTVVKVGEERMGIFTSSSLISLIILIISLLLVQFLLWKHLWRPAVLPISVQFLWRLRKSKEYEASFPPPRSSLPGEKRHFMQYVCYVMNQFDVIALALAGEAGQGYTLLCAAIQIDMRHSGEKISRRKSEEAFRYDKLGCVYEEPVIQNWKVSAWGAAVIMWVGQRV